MPHIISFINFKGGVGKTTTLIQVAETLSSIHKKRVLIIDLDPQTNATIALVGDRRWEQAEHDKQTLAHLFLDKLNGTSDFDLGRALIRSVSNLQPSTIDLVPSSIQLVEVQDRMAEVSSKTSYTMSPMEIIKLELGTIFKNYDYVLIDCPPNLGFITQNGLEVSDYYLTPVIPDLLSTYGLPQIVSRIEKHAKARRLKIRCLGVVFTKMNSSSAVHSETRSELPRLLAGYFAAAGAVPATLFETVIPQANRYSEVMDFDAAPSTFKDKWGTTASGGRALHSYPVELTGEIISRL